MFTLSYKQIWSPHKDSNPEAKQFRRLPPVHRAEGLEPKSGIEPVSSAWKAEHHPVKCFSGLAVLKRLELSSTSVTRRHPIPIRR